MKSEKSYKKSLSYMLTISPRLEKREASLLNAPLFTLGNLTALTIKNSSAVHMEHLTANIR